MTPRNTFVRKVVYAVAIAVLLLPLFWLSQPATNAVKGSKGSPGGKLAQLREESHLTQAQLGQIDPTSATIKLATLGMRGVAANVLWEKAMDYQIKKDWSNFTATLNQIIKVQPNFVSVWIHQGWNLAFNVSVAFDDYRERYRWVIKGIDFMKEGAKYNENQPRLLWETAWTLQQKIGRSDEVKQFRRLFKEDDDFHGSLPVALRDNWLVAKDKYEEAEKLIDSGRGLMGKSPLVYLSSAPMCQMYYGIAIEKDGTFGEVAKRAWVGAADEWQRYGLKDIATSYRTEDDQPVIIHLGEQETHEEMIQQLHDQIDSLQPGLREKIIAEKRAALTAKERDALDTLPEKRDVQQSTDAINAERAIAVSYEELARRMKEPERSKGLKLAKEAAKHEEMVVYIRRSRGTVNYTYWKLRAQVEQGDETVTARRLLHQGEEAFSGGDLIAARDSYRQGLEIWRKVLDDHKALLAEENEATTEELGGAIKRYRIILSQLDEPFPEKFILQDIVDKYEITNGPIDPGKAAKRAAGGNG